MLVNRQKKSIETADQEPDQYVEESGELRRARMKAFEKAEQEAQDQRIALSNRIALESCSNNDPVAREKALQEAIKNNPSKVLAPPTGQELAQQSQEKYRYNYAMPASDPLMEKEPAYVQRQLGYTPFKPKPSLVLQPQPAPRPFGERSHAPQDIPLTGAEARAAELFIKPESKPVYEMKVCAGCGQEVPCNTEYHMRGDVKCYADKN